MRLSQKSMENAALYYLERYSATRATLRRVLQNKVRRQKDAPKEKVQEALSWIEPLLDRYVTSGLINDVAFAEARAGSLRRRGQSARSIAGKLRQKGVDAKTIAHVVADGADAELEAAYELCRRKKLGLDPERRQKDIAALARAGFRYSVISCVLNESREAR